MKMYENYNRPHFTTIWIYWEGNCPHKIISVIQCFKERLAMLELTTMATEGSYKIISVVE
jgi:hypothetical protein